MNEREFYCFVEDTKGIVLSSVRRYLSRQYAHSIDDVVQETYLRVYKGINKVSFKDTVSRNNWIYTIAKNESIRMTERFNKEEIKIKRNQEELINRLSDERKDVDEEIIEIRDIISSLPEKYKIVFELLMKGFTESQIAGRLLIKRGTVKSRIHRGKELIHRNSMKRGIDYELQ